jgi:hypothetical protein
MGGNEAGFTWNRRSQEVLCARSSYVYTLDKRNAGSGLPTVDRLPYSTQSGGSANVELRAIVAKINAMFAL